MIYPRCEAAREIQIEYAGLIFFGLKGRGFSPAVRRAERTTGFQPLRV
jgi:hypothetical protein